MIYEEKSEKLRQRVVRLLANFKTELENKDIREKVLSLVPIFKALKELGKSVIPMELKKAARERILFYFQKYPFSIIKGDEILVISGIQDWPRRLRELRKQFGWTIIDGKEAKEMNKEGDIYIDNVDINKMKTGEYIMVSVTQDKEAAHRWNVANDIRKNKDSVRNKILEYFKLNVGKEIPGSELRYVAGDKTEWARRVRELRTEDGWPIVTCASGKPDMKTGHYMMISDRQSPKHDRKIPDSIRSEVYRRDRYKCVKCGWEQIEWNPADPRSLELHHVIPHLKKGNNEANNLVTICTVCHDQVHHK